MLLGISLWLPVGLHRIVAGRRDWWHWPIAYGVLFAGGCVWLEGGRHPAAIFALLTGGAGFFYLLFTDLTTLWMCRWPFAWTIRERFHQLDERFDLRANAGLLLFVALSMLWLSRVA
ncbi:hypothetical protein WJ08_26025 [Burkholderia vietnamiensis]|nr:hypothetical protein WJ08_26025 [Burkholderia vietnamiensis]KVF39674.1 hypothetical protein WJ10_20390 [Burkholderia vietnamiensis]